MSGGNKIKNVLGRFWDSEPETAVQSPAELEEASLPVEALAPESTASAPLYEFPGFPPGHFYSPIVDVEQIKADAGRIWRDDREVLGINFNEDSHRFLLEQVFPLYLKDFDYPEQLEETPELNRFFTLNSQFGWLDARTLFVLLRHLRPKRMIEVGSGFSSLLTADINHRFLGNSIEFSCIEPYPRPFLLNPLPGLSKLVIQRVQDVEMDLFSTLESGDILFIDSSHVAKTGSDVNHLVFEVLPRLQKGVYVHIHDIFLPQEYCTEWVIDEARNWNEQYIVRALLMYSSAFRIIFGSYYANFRFESLVAKALGTADGMSGGSLWLQRL